MTMTQALFTFAKYVTELDLQCIELVRHIEIGDRALYTGKASQLILNHLADDRIPDDVRQQLRNAITGSAEVAPSGAQMLTVQQYAALVGRDVSTIKQRIKRGATPAVMVGRVWMIPADTPLIDNRQRSAD